MDGKTSWLSHCFNDVAKDEVAGDMAELDSLSELSEENNTEIVSISLDVLPDDLLGRIISNLPIASVFRAGCVSKRWNDIVKSRRFLCKNSYTYKPWYFMFTSSDEAIGYAYDPILKKWYSIDLPCIETPNWYKACSRGLVCFMDNDTRTGLSICNPISGSYKTLKAPPGLKFPDYSALAISVRNLDLHECIYNVAVVKSKQVQGNFSQWNLSICVYDSEAMTWRTPVTEVLTNWRGGDEGVICDGVLYFLIYATGGVGGRQDRHGLIGYNLSNNRSNGSDSLINSRISVPCPLTCGRLMNLKENLVLVGGIGKIDRPDIIKGIGIWILRGREWREVARMPYKFFQGFGELDDVFASSGSHDLIYIQSYGSPALLAFDMILKNWRWAHKCPVTKRFPLQLFSGFCFEPSLGIDP